MQRFSRVRSDVTGRSAAFTRQKRWNRGLPRKTDATNPADWLAIAEEDLALIRLAVEREISFAPCRGKLAEALEKVLKAELIRLNWSLERTHDLQRLAKLLRERRSTLWPSSSKR